MSLTSNQLRVDAALRTYLAAGLIQVNDRLPSFADLARHLDTSVSVLQMVMPRLVAEGILGVRPRVGTFLRRRPDLPGATPHAGAALRFFINEEAATTSPAWRRIVARFEELHPGVCIEMALTDTIDPLLRRPDLLLTEHRVAAQRRAAGGFLEWADENVWNLENRVPFARALWEADQPRDALPVLLGAQVLFAARGSTSPVGTPLSGLMATLDDTTSYGLVITSFTTPLWQLGMGSTGIRADDPELHAYLEMLATTPPPRLVMPCDFSDTSYATRLALLVGRRCHYFLSSLWAARVAERGAWDLLPPPGTGPVACGAMSLMVANGPRAEAAIALARFIAGAEGQQILSESEVLIPTWQPLLASHRHAGLFAAIAARGQPRMCVVHDPAWADRHAAADRVLAALRVQRATPAEAMAAVVAIDQPA